MRGARRDGLFFLKEGELDGRMPNGTFWNAYEVEKFSNEPDAGGRVADAGSGEAEYSSGSSG